MIPMFLLQGKKTLDDLALFTSGHNALGLCLEIPTGTGLTRLALGCAAGQCCGSELVKFGSGCYLIILSF